MTDQKAAADARIEAAKERALKTARDWRRETMCTHQGLNEAMIALEAAEAERAALDRPGLMTPEERVDQHNSSYAGRLCMVTDDRADIFAKASALPRAAIRSQEDPLGQRDDWINIVDLGRLLGP